MSCRVAGMLECPKNSTSEVPNLKLHVSQSINFTSTFLKSVSSTASTSLPTSTEAILTVNPEPKVTEAVAATFSGEDFYTLFLSSWCLAILAIMALSWKTSKDKRQQTDETLKETAKSQSKWVRPLGGIEFLMGFGGFYHTMNTVQAIWLSSKQEITANSVKSALYLLGERIPQLKLSIQRRGLKLWYKRIEKFTIDFESSSGDTMQVYQKILSTNYDMNNGPLWRARLVSLPTVSKNNGRHNNYALMFSVQHAITDGTTNMLICKEIVSLLNSILGKKSIEKSIFPIIPPLMDSIHHDANFYFYFKYFCQKLFATLIGDFAPKAYFNNALPRPIPYAKETKILSSELSEEQTIQLLKHCKTHKVTVHSCIVAAANFAMFKIAQKRASYKLESSKIYLTNCINMRRYYDGDYDNATGCHISLDELQSRISVNDFNDFWKQAIYLQNTLRKHIRERTHINVTPLFYPAAVIYAVNDYLTSKNMLNRTDCHFVTTNMGDLTSMLPEATDEDPIEITNILRSVSCESAGNPFMLTFHTFRQKFMLSIDYYTTKMADDVAEEMFSILKSYITSIAETGDINVTPL